jgi:hypothetical protein
MDESRNYSLFWVMGFWWLLLSILKQLNISTGVSDSSWSKFWIHELSILGVLALSLIVAIYAEYRAIVYGRSSILYKLQAQEHLGLISSLGSSTHFLPCPWVNTGIVKSLDFDSKNLQLWLSKSQLRASIEVLRLIEQLSTEYPLHAATMLNCLNLMAQEPLCPAYHGLESDSSLSDKERHFQPQNIHGNTTLIEHAMQVCVHGLQISKNFDYQGIRGEYNKIAKRDASFQLAASDPMIPVICLAHDIGKLITFKRNKSGKVLQIQGLHGQVGCRALAQSPFIKALPMNDQSALLKALHFYHHPLDFTLDVEAKIESDRQAALMMLLIKADHRSSIEEARLESRINHPPKPI